MSNVSLVSPDGKRLDNLEASDEEVAILSSMLQKGTEIIRTTSVIVGGARKNTHSSQSMNKALLRAGAGLGPWPKMVKSDATRKRWEARARAAIKTGDLVVTDPPSLS